jgi:transcriptional regulator with XRE-family HTH domain
MAQGGSGLFSSVIREARLARKLTQQQFAELCDVTQPAVGKWERGSFIAESTLVKIAGALGEPLEVLLYPVVSRGYRDFVKRKRKGEADAR